MALLNLVYRDALFPRDAYRRCFEVGPGAAHRARGLRRHTTRSRDTSSGKRRTVGVQPPIRALGVSMQARLVKPACCSRRRSGGVRRRDGALSRGMEHPGGHDGAVSSRLTALSGASVFPDEEHPPAADNQLLLDSTRCPHTDDNSCGQRQRNRNRELVCVVGNKTRKLQVTESWDYKHDP